MTVLVLSFGAIAEARVRQQRRRVAGGLVICLLAAGLSVFALTATRHSSPGVAVSVLLTRGATPIQEDHVIDAAGSVAQTGSLRRISAAQGLAMMAREYPNLVKGLPHNPLSTILRFRVAKTDLDSAEQALSRLPGVKLVSTR